MTSYPVRTTVLTVLALISVAALALGGGALAAGTGRTVYYKAAGQSAKKKPQRIVINTYTSVYYGTKMHWHRWGRGKTTGRGTIRYNSCKPSCASRNYRSTHGSVALSHAKKCSNGRHQYLRIRLRFHAGGQRGFPETVNCSGEVTEIG